MNSKLRILLFIGLMALLTNTAVASENSIRVVGSNTVFPIVEAVSARFQELNPGVAIDAEGPGSGAGITALIDGQTDLAPMSRAPKDKEKTEAEAKGIELAIKTVGVDALIIIVNANNPLDGLTSQQITGIYNGSITNWSGVGWADGGDIYVIERDENSGTHDYFNEHFLDGEEVDPTKVYQHSQFSSTSQLFDLVSSTSSAIGYGGLAYLDASVKALKVDGVEPTKANAKSDAYTVARPLFIVYDKNTVSDLAKQFVDYVLSPEGQFIVEDVGYVSVGEVAASLSTIETSAPISSIPVFISIITLGTIISKKRN